MGVIDLNARVKALEENSGNSAEIDQIEAAVTALEETVNGDGDTDLGLVGDVADLQEDVGELQTAVSGITPVSYAKTTISSVKTGTILSNRGGCYYETYGKLVHIHLAISGVSSGSLVSLYDIPSAIAPPSGFWLQVPGCSSYQNELKRVDAYIDSGTVKCYTDTTYMQCDLWYFKA
jgi:hypothetical protein